MTPSRYPYHPHALGLCFATLAVLGASLFMGWMAQTNDRGLIFESVINFDVRGASLFYWFMTLIAAAGFVFFLRCCFVTLFGSPTLELTDNYISAPPNAASKNNVVVDFSKVRRMQLFEHKGRRFLDIEFLPDREFDTDKLRIRERFLPDREIFEGICDAVAGGVDEKSKSYEKRSS